MRHCKAMLCPRNGRRARAAFLLASAVLLLGTGPIAYGPGVAHAQDGASGGAATTASPGANPPVELDTRGRFRAEIRRRFPVVPGVTDRRHIVSDELTRSIIEKVLNSSSNPTDFLRRVGYDPAGYGGSIQRAARAWQLDAFNDPNNIWTGGALENQRLGRLIRTDKNILGPYRIDLPPEPTPVVRRISLQPSTPALRPGASRPPIRTLGAARTGGVRLSSGVRGLTGNVATAAAGWAGTHFGHGLGETEVTPGVTVHDELADAIRSGVGDEPLIFLGTVADEVDGVVTTITKPLEGPQEVLAGSIRTVVGDDLLLAGDRLVTQAGQTVQDVGRSAGNGVVATAQAGVQLAEEHGGGIGGYVDAWLEFYGLK